MTKFAKRCPFAALASIIIFSTFAAQAAGQTLSGTVTNGTTNKPAAGDEVVLINLANGMDVAASTKADATGKFSFTLKDSGNNSAPHLIRAVHQGVTYHQIAPPGTSKVEVKVFDVAKQVSGINLTADVFRLQADSSVLQGIRLFAVDNISSPPVTQQNPRNFEFYLPPQAKIVELQARAPGGQPIHVDATPQSEANRYAINFPLRPGETQIQLEFTVPYSGQIKVDPKPLYPAEHFVVVLPKTMQFAPADASLFKPMQDPNQGDTTVQVAQQTRPGQPLGFTVSGSGTISDQPAQQAGDGSAAMGGPQGGADNRPGGGLGAPIDAPDPLEKYRWPIIGGFLVLLALGGWIVTKRQGAVSAASGSGGSTVSRGPFSAPITGPGADKLMGAATKSSAASETKAAGGSDAAGSAGKSGALLDALKEELFQLEVERKQGKIDDEEYEKARAALDQTLDRALKRLK